WNKRKSPGGCSKRLSARPQRTITIRGGWDDPNCAQCSHPPTHWHAETCHLPGRGLSGFPHFALREAARLSFTARPEAAHSHRAASASKKDGLAAPLPPF